MYAKTEYNIKLRGGHLTAINSNLGLKQGDPLSSILFNIYIDDIDLIFDESCSPIELQDVRINHSLYADDLSLMSLSRDGLQKCLDKLSEFAKKKHLKVNIQKSKTMTFTKSGKFLKDTFYLDNTALEPVNSFCYLGFDVKSSGTVKNIP